MTFDTFPFNESAREREKLILKLKNWRGFEKCNVEKAEVFHTKMHILDVHDKKCGNWKALENVSWTHISRQFELFPALRVLHTTPQKVTRHSFFTPHFSLIPSYDIMSQSRTFNVNASPACDYRYDEQNYTYFMLENASRGNFNVSHKINFKLTLASLPHRPRTKHGACFKIIYNILQVPHSTLSSFRCDEMEKNEIFSLAPNIIMESIRSYHHIVSK